MKQLADWKHGHKKKCKELSAAQPQPAAAARAQTAEPKPAARGTRTIDWMIYNKAIEDTVRMKEEWRRRMSELALSGHETRGKGMVLVQHSNLDADGIPPLVPDALAGAVFCTMPELRARVSPELYTSLLARDQEAYDRRVSFVLAMSTPHSRDRMHSNAETMAFAPGRPAALPFSSSSLALRTHADKAAREGPVYVAFGCVRSAEKRVGGLSGGGQGSGTFRQGRGIRSPSSTGPRTPRGRCRNRRRTSSTRSPTQRALRI